MSKFYIMILGAALTITACKTVPKVEPEPEQIEIVTEPVRTCTPISAVERLVIPAETKTMTVITMIDNPPYDPIERREEVTREIKPAQTVYVDSEGREVLDICQDDLAVIETVVEEAGAEIIETQMQPIK